MKRMHLLFAVLMVLGGSVASRTAEANMMVMPHSGTTFGPSYSGGGISGIGGVGYYRPVTSIGISIQFAPSYQPLMYPSGCATCFRYPSYGYNGGYGGGYYGQPGYGYAGGFGFAGSHGSFGFGFQGGGFYRPIAHNCHRCGVCHKGGCRRRRARAFSFSFGFGPGGFGFGFNSVRF